MRPLIYMRGLCFTGLLIALAGILTLPAVGDDRLVSDEFETEIFEQFTAGSPEPSALKKMRIDARMRGDRALVEQLDGLEKRRTAAKGTESGDIIRNPDCPEIFIEVPEEEVTVDELPFQIDLSELMNNASSSKSRSGSKSGPSFFGDDLIGGFEDLDDEHRNPSLVIDSSGRLHLAYEEAVDGENYIKVFRSSNNGQSWTSRGLVFVPAPMRVHSPCLAIGEGDENVLFVAYILDDGTIETPRLFYKDLDSTELWNSTIIPTWAGYDGYAKPFIWTDSLDYNQWYLHYVCEGIVSSATDNINVCAWRSTDYGDTMEDGIVALGDTDLDAWRDPHACYGTPAQDLYICAYNETQNSLYMVKSQNDGLAWNTPKFIYDLGTAPSRPVAPVIAAAREEDNLLICHTRYSSTHSSDCIGYTYSRDCGHIWTSMYILTGSTALDEFAPTLIACEGGGSFHLTFTDEDHKVMYNRRPQHLNEGWQTFSEQVNDGTGASTTYPSKAITAHWKYDKAFIAWGDYRDGWPDYDVYVDYAGNVDELTVPTDTETIQEAIDAMFAGSIFVEPGTYMENLSYDGRPLSILATEGADYTMIDGKSKGPVVAFEGEPAQSASIIGFTLVNGMGFGPGGGIRIVNSSPIIMNNIIAYNTAESGGGISCNEAYPVAVNNTIFGNYASSAGGGIHTFGGGAPEFSNSIIWGNTSPFGPGTVWVGAKPVITYSNCQDMFVGEGNIYADPEFVDPAGLDFHLLYTSPCRDAGTKGLTLLPLFDHEMDPRQDGDGLWDMGADEFHRHFYYKSKGKPGSPIAGRLVGVPGETPVGIWFGMGVLDPPIPSKWGEFYLMPPYIFIGPFGSMPADGVMDLYSELPTDITPPADIPAQAMVGAWFTNLMTIRVR